MLRSALPRLFAAASAAAFVACGSSESTSSATGTGGSATASTSTATGAGTGGSATTSTSTATGMGSLVTNACTNAADAAVLMTKDAKSIAASCGQTNADDEPGTYNCIKMGTGLSDACTSCYDDSVVCETDHCSTMCLSDPASQACIECREMYCVPAFQSCSGLDKG